MDIYVYIIYIKKFICWFKLDFLAYEVYVSNIKWHNKWHSQAMIFNVEAKRIFKIGNVIFNHKEKNPS